MIIRTLSERQYAWLYRDLVEKAHAEPMEEWFTVELRVDRACYAIKIQPERENQMAVLQAYRLHREKDGINFELIREDALLSAFLEILMEQGVA